MNNPVIWVIHNIDLDGNITRKAVHNPEPRSGDSHLHILDGVIIAIHTPKEYEITAREILEHYWALVQSERITLDRERDGKSRYSSHKIAGVDFQLEGQLPDIDQDDFLIIYGNHTATIATSDFLWTVEHYLRFKSVYVASETANPFVIWPAVRLQRALIIPDAKDAGALQIIHDRMKHVLNGPRSVVIFPDGHRWTPKRRRWQEKNFSHRDHAQDVLPQVLFARSGGLWQIIQATRDKKVRIMELTNAMNYPAAAFFELHDRPLVFHVEVIEIDATDIPTERKDFDLWLNDRWHKLALRMRDWRN